MDAQTKIIRASHMIDMNDIIREGNPTLRAVAEDVPSHYQTKTLS